VLATGDDGLASEGANERIDRPHDPRSGALVAHPTTSSTTNTGAWDRMAFLFKLETTNGAPAVVPKCTVTGVMSSCDVEPRSRPSPSSSAGGGSVGRCDAATGVIRCMQWSDAAEAASRNLRAGK